MFKIYDANAKHHTKYYRTLAGVKNRIEEEMKTSRKNNLIGDGFEMLHFNMKVSLGILKRDSRVDLRMSKKSGYDLHLVIIKIETED